MGNFETSIESIDNAASWMETNPIATAKELQTTLQELVDYCANADWSNVPSCLGFGGSYNATIAAYKAVADDLLSDAQDMQTALKKIANQYRTSDQNSQDALYAAIAGITETESFANQNGQSTYQDNRGQLHSDDPQQADGGDADTGSSGSGGSGSGGSGSGGAPSNGPSSGQTDNTGAS